jgi:hypothetical protein
MAPAKLAAVQPEEFLNQKQVEFRALANMSVR